MIAKKKKSQRNTVWRDGVIPADCGDKYLQAQTENTVH